MMTLRDRLSFPAVLASGSVVTMILAVFVLLRIWACCPSPWTYQLLWIAAAATLGGFLVGWTARTTVEKLVGGPISGFLGTFAASMFAIAVVVATSEERLEVIPLLVLIVGALFGAAAAAGSFLGAVLGMVAGRIRSEKQPQ